METREASFYSPDGEISFVDPCYLDGARSISEINASAYVVPFAHGAGEYLVSAQLEEVGGWGERVVAVDVRPLAAGPLDGGWSRLGRVDVDTATIAALSASRLVQSIDGALNWESLSRHQDLEAKPAERPYAVVFATGFGDGSYDLEVLEGHNGPQAVRIVFVDLDELDELDED